MPVDAVVEKEPFHFLCYLLRRVHIAPFPTKFGEHTHGSASLDLAHSTKHVQFIIGHSHVCLVSLNVCRCDGLQLSCRYRVQEPRISYQFENTSVSERYSSRIGRLNASRA